ncbi:Uncharacterised protein [uncultured archaeon]|nr:Uncharacterised protein [uncultured archaeon]
MSWNRNHRKEREERKAENNTFANFAYSAVSESIITQHAEGD